jgi:hypothetical protein
MLIIKIENINYVLTITYKENSTSKAVFLSKTLFYKITKNIK